jgi:hypothetical protein
MFRKKELIILFPNSNKKKKKINSIINKMKLIKMIFHLKMKKIIKIIIIVKLSHINYKTSHIFKKK